MPVRERNTNRDRERYRVRQNIHRWTTIGWQSVSEWRCCLFVTRKTWYCIPVESTQLRIKMISITFATQWWGAIKSNNRRVRRAYLCIDAPSQLIDEWSRFARASRALDYQPRDTYIVSCICAEAGPQTGQSTVTNYVNCEFNLVTELLKTKMFFYSEFVHTFF